MFNVESTIGKFENKMFKIASDYSVHPLTQESTTESTDIRPQLHMLKDLCLTAPE